MRHCRLRWLQRDGFPKTQASQFTAQKLRSTNVPLKGWTNGEIKLGNKVRNLRLLVADTLHGAKIFGMQWFKAFGLTITDDNTAPPEVINFVEPVNSSINTDMVAAPKQRESCQANQVSPHRMYQSWPEP